MTSDRCPQCQRERSQCSCQAPLYPRGLSPRSPWQDEVRQRVEKYRRSRRPDSPWSGIHGSPDAGRILEFRLPTGSGITADLEALADAVTAPPAAVEEEYPPYIPTPPAWTPPPLQLNVAPALDPAEDWSQPVAAPAPVLASSPRVRLRPEPMAMEMLQLPLPMVPATPPPQAAPLEVAPLPNRLAAAVVDGAIVLLAAFVFAMAAWLAPGHAFEGLQVTKRWAAAVILVPGGLMAMYLLLCHFLLGATLGMQQAGLQLRSFEGELTPAFCRRRGLCTVVSLLALGLGFAWAFCDPQGLGWHDYMSHTYLALARPAAP